MSNNRKKRTQKTRVLTEELERDGVKVGDFVDGAKIVPSRRKAVAPASEPEPETMSVKEIYDEMSPLQRAAVHYIVGAATSDLVKSGIDQAVENALTNALGEPGNINIPVDVQD